MTRSCSGQRSDTTPPSIDRQAHAIRVMKFVDALKPPMRELVHTFGAQIVSDMIADGHRDAAVLREELETWRERQQEAWLATDYITARDREYALAAIRWLR